MYEIDSQDIVTELANFPQCEAGAPSPVVVATDCDLFLTYIIADHDNRWDDSMTSQLSNEEYIERWATIRFHRIHSHMFGMPNDEALMGHPLWERGLRCYGVYRIEMSSWTRKLERMNSVHDNHDKDSFLQARHYIFAFHDTTFECVAHGCELAGVHRASQRRVLSDIVRLL